MLKNKQLSESDISALTIKPSFMIDHTYSKAAVQAVDELIQFIDNNPLNRKSVSTLFPHFYSNRNIIYGAFEAQLGYSLYANGFFNKGNAPIKDVMDFLSKVLKKDIPNRRRLFFQIRERKGNVTKYLDELKADLIRYMDELDQQKEQEF